MKPDPVVSDETEPMQKRVLIVDDDPVERQRLEGLLTRSGYHPLAVASGLDALSLLDNPDTPRIDAMILDLVMPDLDGMGVLARMKDVLQSPPVIMSITEGNIDQVASTIRAGALDFIVRPAGIERLTLALNNGMRRQVLEAAIRDVSEDETAPQLADLIGTSQVMERLRAQAQRAARSSIPVLVTGPSGSGKARLARAIHRESDRSGKALLTLHAGNTNPADLRQAIESCLTLKSAMLITHVGLLDADCQTVLAEAFMRDCFAFTPGGPKAARKIRLYATASADLAELSREGRFRADLAMRLAVQPLRMPALGERRDDMLPLIDDVLARVSASLKRSIAGFTAEALQALQQQDWGDNIRGLRKAIQQAAMRTQGHIITLQDCALDEACQTNPPLARAPASPAASVRRVLPSELSVSLTGTDRRLRPFDEIEADILRQALSHCDHHIGRAASALGIGRSTFYRKARDFGLLDGPDFSTGFSRNDSAIAASPRSHAAPSRAGEAA